MRSPEEVARNLGIACEPCVINPDEPGQYIACLTHDDVRWDGQGAGEDFCSEVLRLIRARDAEVGANVLRSLSYEWGNTFNDYRTNENIVIYTSPSRQSAIERAEGSSELIAVQRRISEWETIKPEDEDE